MAVAVDEGGRLLIDRAARSVLMVEFSDAWPQEALAGLLRARLGLTIPRNRMAATHLDLGDELYGHFMWVQLHPGEVAAFPTQVAPELQWVTDRDLTDDPDLLAPDPVRSEVLRLAFGWTDAEPTAAPAIPPKVDPDHVDWADRFVRAAALDAMADPESTCCPAPSASGRSRSAVATTTSSCSPPTARRHPQRPRRSHRRRRDRREGRRTGAAPAECYGSRGPTSNTR